MNYSLQYYPLHFIRPAGTSRGVMRTKKSWILVLEKDGIAGKGEISIIEDLSPEYTKQEDFEKKIHHFCDLLIQQEETEIQNLDDIRAFPSILFGLESAMLDLKNGGQSIYFRNDFTSGKKRIPINGLVWMGDETMMREQIFQKIELGFTTVKMKIGAIDLKTELKLLSSIRHSYSSGEITLRVDANGAFSPKEAKNVLELLAELEIHSIEQPIKAGNWIAMQDLCSAAPTPIALDEELIGIWDRERKIDLLETIRPQFIILKPSLHGGISGTKEWIELATERKIDWWMTSALESNVGLNAICQLTAEYDNSLPQGLGTGSLYSNNIESKLVVEGGFIFKQS